VFWTVRVLDSPLIYLDDKTFGQAVNHVLLPEIAARFRRIMSYGFQGFIIQTTAAQIIHKSEEFFRESGIKYVEIGVESYNNDILGAMNKPAREMTIQAAVSKLKRLGIQVVANVMIGLPGETAETYNKTLSWLLDNKSAISHLNIYTYVDYDSPKPTSENCGGHSEIDKSFAKTLYDIGTTMLESEV